MGASVNGFSVLIKETPDSPLPQCERMAFYEPERGPLVDTESAGTMTLDFPTFKTALNKLPLFLSHLPMVS